MTATRQATNATRELTVLRRYEIKVAYNDLNPGDVILVIRNDQGVEYTTTLRRTKRHECTCPSRKPCYHIARMVSRENARYDAAKVAAFNKAAAEAEMAEVARIAEEARAYGEELAKVKAAEMAEALAEQANEAELAAAFAEKMAAAKEALKAIEPTKTEPRRRAYVTNITAAAEHKAAIRAEMAEVKAAKQRAESSQSAEKRRENANFGGTRAFSKLR